MNEPKHPHNPYSRIFGGLTLILLGTLFLLTEMDKISWGDWWAYFLAGLGGLMILEGIVRSFSRSAREHVTGRFIGGAILLIVGGSHIFDWHIWWPYILIAVGAVMLLSVIWHPGKLQS
jgi:hypothetical protein